MRQKLRFFPEKSCLAGFLSLLACFCSKAEETAAFAELRETIAALDAEIAKNPDSAANYQSRGVAYFELGEFEKSISDFDRVIELFPGQEPHHWQRGIAYYYAGEYEKGVQQFELHKSVNPNDVENAAWHFICMAKADSVQAAQDTFIPIQYDSRIPMAEIWALFSGTGSSEKVLQAAGPIDSRSSVSRQRHCYAHLYIGLYHESQGHTDRAKKHIALAATKFSMNNYMGMVARVHNRLINP